MRLITAARRGEQTATHVAAAAVAVGVVATAVDAGGGVGASWEVVGCADEGVRLSALF